MSAIQNIIVPEDCEALLKKQFTALGALDKINQSQLDLVEKYMNPDTKTVLDLGCGVGRFTAFMAKTHPDLHYYLGDVNVVDEIETQPWNAQGSDGYPGKRHNLLDATKSMMEANSVKHYTLVDIQKQTIESLGPIDLLVSWFAVGFHYPVGLYDAKVQIFTVRKSALNGILEFFQTNNYTDIIELDCEKKYIHLVVRK